MSPGAVAIQIANRIGDTKNLGPGETGVATATCQSGELITGGGLAGINVAVTTMRVSDIEPPIWLVVAKAGGTANGEMHAEVRCKMYKMK